ncbi:MAG: MgtC/SapB family protein [Deferribacterales bacterium]
MNDFIPLFLSLALGLLIGLERGWREVIDGESSPFFGLRTFGLIGLLGGIIGFISNTYSNLLIAGIAFAAVTVLLTAVHVSDCGRPHGVGITTVVAADITFCLGILSSMGFMSMASSIAVVTAVILSMKPFVYQWVRKLEAKEIHATLKLLLISVVLLPVLPDKGYGPYSALNPYEVWWFVVLITGMSFAGYFAIRIAGAGKGIMITGILGGLVSSTALTLSFSRLGKHSQLKRVFSAGILVACGTMFPRMLIEVSVVNKELLKLVAVPLIVSGASVYLGMAFFWFTRARDKEAKADVPPLSNPFQILPALKFAGLISMILLFSQFIKEYYGDTGIIVLAFFSGLTDVDAITISMARLAHGELSHTTAATAIMTAAATNTILKGLLVLLISNRQIGIRVMGVFITALAAGGLALYIAA